MDTCYDESSIVGSHYNPLCQGRISQNALISLKTGTEIIFCTRITKMIILTTLDEGVEPNLATVAKDAETSGTDGGF